MKQVKTFTLAACALLAVIVAVQNTEAVDTRLLFMTVTMPRALLLIITLLIGAAVGLVIGARLNPREKPKESSKNRQ